MIPDDVVDRVREAADPVSVIGEFVKLKRVGTSFRGPCPFHHGKGDNFSISPRGGYKCFVCGESGDVFTFVQKQLGLDFVEAVKSFTGGRGADVILVPEHPFRLSRICQLLRHREMQGSAFSIIVARPMFSSIRLKPGPLVTVMVFVPVHDPPMIAAIDASSSSIWMNVPPMSGNRLAIRSTTSVEGVIG